MTNPFLRIPQQTRLWSYGVGTTGVALAGIYGIVDENQAAGWVALLGALFNGAMAASNTAAQRKVTAEPELSDDWA